MVLRPKTRKDSRNQWSVGSSCLLFCGLLGFFGPLTKSLNLGLGNSQPAEVAQALTVGNNYHLPNAARIYSLISPRTCHDKNRMPPATSRIFHFSWPRHGLSREHKKAAQVGLLSLWASRRAIRHESVAGHHRDNVQKADLI